MARLKPALILLHGLPGAGKTTAARLIAKIDPEIFFVDWGEHPAFGEKSLREILTEEYLARGNGRSMITEGVLKDRGFRDQLVTSVIASTAEAPVPLRSGVIIFVDEKNDVLATRRRRSAEVYAERRAAIVEGSECFPWIRYSTNLGTDDPDARARALLRMIEDVTG